MKGLYYLRTEAKSRAENVSEKVERVALQSDTSTIVYTKPNCPFCQLAKEELKLRGIPYDEINLEEIGKTAREVTGRKGVKTVPQYIYKVNMLGVMKNLWNYLTKQKSKSRKTAKHVKDNNGTIRIFKNI